MSKLDKQPEEPLRILLVDDDEDEYVLMRSLVGQTVYNTQPSQYNVEWASTYEAALTAFENQTHDVYLVDYRLGDANGLDLARELAGRGNKAPIIILTGQGSYEVDAAAMKAGASDYLVKDQLNAPLLERSIRYAIEHKQAQYELEKRVQERTHELEKANRRLRAEINERRLAQEALKESEKRFRKLADTTSAAIFILRDLEISYSNPAVKIITGYSPEELFRQSFLKFIHPDYQAILIQHGLGNNWAPDFPARYELKAVRKDGQERWLDITAGSIEHEGQPAWIVTAFDITERDIAENELRKAKSELEERVADRTSELSHANLQLNQANEELRKISSRKELLASLSRAFNEAGLDTSAVLNTIVTRVTESFGEGCLIRLLSKDRQWLVPQAFHATQPDIMAIIRDYYAGIAHKPNEGLAGKVMESGQSQLIEDFSAGDAGEFYPKELLPWREEFPINSLIIVPLRAHNQIIGTLGVIRIKGHENFTRDELLFFEDLADRAALAIENAMLHSEVQKLAITDSLTDQYNRRGFFDLGKREIDRLRRSGRPFSILMFDIDRFKEVNDRCGHAAGDHVLRSVALHCRSMIRESDILGRLGGDEFAILLHETGMKTALEIAERIRSSLAERPVMAPERTSDEDCCIQVSVSVGAVCARKNVEDLETLIAQADRALYNAKKNGRNRVEVD